MAATATSQYLLRWNDHLANYGDVFLSLREQEEFVDCSIACDDGVVGAHRIVLAGCSTYLRDLFARVAKPHPVIFLPNTSHAIVLMLMEFIYRGQVHIPEHHLQQLVVLGHALKIKGLTKIMVPVSTGSSKISEPNSPINPLDFSHGLLSTNNSSSSFYTVPYCNTKLDASVLSREKVPQTPKEDKRRKNGQEEEEEEENNDKDKRRTSSDGVNYERVRPQRRHLNKKTSVKKKACVRSRQPAGKLYFKSRMERVTVGAYAFLHGTEAAKSYVKQKYDVNIRESTLNRLLSLYQRCEKTKEIKVKHLVEKIRLITSQE